MGKTYSYHYYISGTRLGNFDKVKVDGIVITKTKVLCPRSLQVTKDQLRKNHNLGKMKIKSLTFLGERIDKTGRAKL
jgi:hypothetical protein